LGADTCFIAEPLGSAPDARASFLLLRQKKGAKEKATPGYAVGDADSPALLGKPGDAAGAPSSWVLLLGKTRRSTQEEGETRRFSPLPRYLVLLWRRIR
jgi:hypothetical protein